MAWKDSDEITIAGDGQVYFAPVGTTLPQPGANPTAALNAAFVGAGWITTDGATLSVGSEVTDIMSWQSMQPIRRVKTSQEIQVSWAMQQWNEQNVVLAFGGGDVTAHGSGLYSYTFPEPGDELEERSLILETIDGSKHTRFVFPRGNVTEAVEAQFTRESSADLPITFKVLAPEAGGSPGWIVSDDPAYAVGS